MLTISVYAYDPQRMTIHVTQKSNWMCQSDTVSQNHVRRSSDLGSISPR